MKRRQFLRLLGIVSGSAVMSACGSSGRSPNFISYILPPEEGVVPGEAGYHPSTCTECPAGCGLMVRATIVTGGTQVGTIVGAVACCGYVVFDLLVVEPH